jgi:hypothetical protein
MMKHLIVGSVSTNQRSSHGTTSRRWAIALIMLVSGLVTACNTTKATVDTTVNFSSSTTPQSLFTQDGMVAKDQQMNLYTAVAWESIQQDIARGHGEYVTSLGALLDTPAQHQTAPSSHWQDRYNSLFPEEARGPRESIAALRTGLSSSGHGR